MNRDTRLLIVLALSLAVAGGATYFVYRTISTMPTKEVEIAKAFAVVAARPLPLGTKVSQGDVKVVAWPAENPIPGGFTSVEQVVNRGLLVAVQQNEPLTDKNLAVPGAGAGLPPTITPGMRAISVRVNEVVGVAGFVLPGNRVDVMVILPQGTDSIARVVVSNVQVLTAGTRYDQEDGKQGNAIPSSVVTLLASPEDAERIVLAASQGQIQLTLRNPLDVAPTASPGIRTSSLAGAPQQRPVVESKPVAPRSRPLVVVEASTMPPPPPPRRAVEVIRGAKRSEETIKQ